MRPPSGRGDGPLGAGLDVILSTVQGLEETIGDALGDIGCTDHATALICTAAMWQMGVHAKLLVEGINAPDDDGESGEAYGDVDYTVIYSRTDEIIIPDSSPPLASGGEGRVANVAVQDLCEHPTKNVSHLGIQTDGATFAVVLDANSCAWR